MRTRHGMTRALAFAAIALTTACEAPTVPLRDTAYDFVYRGFEEPVIYRWAVGEKIGVYVVPTNDPDRAGLLEAAFREAADAWNEAVLFGEFEFVAADLNEADVVLIWADQPMPLDTDACPPAPGGVGWTTFCATEDLEEISGYPLLEGQHLEDGVHMIVEVIYTTSTEDVIPALVAHEFGHVLGIGTHPCDLDDDGCERGEGAYESLMYEGIPEVSGPTAADRETIDLLYHTAADLTP